MDAILSAEARRRTRLARLVKDGLVILQSAKHAVKSRDVDHHPYHPDPYFYYLTGFAEPNAAILMGVKNGKIESEILLCRPRDPSHEQWEGERMGPARARRRLQIAQADDIAQFGSYLADMLGQYERAHYLPGSCSKTDALLCKTAANRRLRSRDGSGYLQSLCDVSAHLDGMRMIKDKEEIALMRRAAKISDDGHRAAMRAAMHAKNECEIDAAIGAAFRVADARHAFAPIVATGKNAGTLHYTDNRARIRNGDMVLTDAGAQWRGYAGDITRAFPARGRFSKEQAAVYDAVLDAQRRAIAAVRPGARWQSIENTAARALCRHLKDLKICRGSAKNIFSSKRYRRFYMHRVGHLIGLDVHDPGRMTGDDGLSIRLRPGMTLTVEPGLYLPSESDIPPAFRGIGIRIEDTVLVTSGGYETLTRAPKTRAEIESFMNAESG